MKPPIAEPFPSASLKNERLFRVDFWRSFFSYFWIFLLLVTLECALLSPLMLRLRPAQVSGLFPKFFLLVVAGALLSAVFGLGFSVEVSAQGLRHGQKFWSKARDLAWDDITRVQRIWIGVPYARVVTARKQKTLWLPLRLREMEAFARAVEELAPAENPLRLFLKKRKF